MRRVGAARRVILPNGGFHPPYVLFSIHCFLASFRNSSSSWRSSLSRASALES